MAVDWPDEENNKASPDRMDAYFRAVGRVIRNWAHLESALVLILTNLLNTDQYRARIVWNSITSSRAQRALLETLAESFVEERHLPTFRSLLRRAKTLADKRNTLAHGMGGLDPETGEPFFMKDQKDSTLGFKLLAEERHTIKDIDLWGDAILNLQTDFFAWTVEAEMHIKLKMHRDQAPPPPA